MTDPHPAGSPSVEVAPRPRPRPTAAMLFGAALCARVAFLAFTLGSTPPATFSIARSGPFWPPLPQLVGATLFALLGPHRFAIHLVYACVGALVSPLSFAIATEIGLDRRTAVWAGAMAALYPYYVAAPTTQPDVGFSIALTAAAIWLFLRWMNAPARRDLLLGFAAAYLLILLDRPSSLTVFAFLAIVGFVRLRRTGRLWSGAVALGLLALTSLGYATWRRAEYGTFTVLSSNGGYNLLIGNCAYTEQVAWRHDIPSFEQVAIDHPELFRDTDESLRRRALGFAGEDLLREARLIGIKIVRYWDPRLEQSERYSTAKNLAYTVPFVGVVVLAACGALHGLRRRRAAPMLFLFGCILSYGLAGILTHPMIRMRMYTEFLLLVAAAVGATSLLDLGGARPSEP